MLRHAEDERKIGVRHVLPGMDGIESSYSFKKNIGVQSFIYTNANTIAKTVLFFQENISPGPGNSLFPEQTEHRVERSAFHHIHTPPRSSLI